MTNIGRGDGSSLEVRITPAPGRVVLHPVGPINSVNAESFKSKLMSAVTEYSVPIELDLEEVPYATAAAFHAILTAIDDGLHVHRLHFTHCSEVMLRELQLINLSGLIETSH
jgi:anti-anti-sigma regulatory factor